MSASDQIEITDREALALRRMVESEAWQLFLAEAARRKQLRRDHSADHCEDLAEIKTNREINRVTDSLLNWPEEQSQSVR